MVRCCFLHESGLGRVQLEQYRFEVLEANQRKVLRLRARHLPTAAQTAPR
jgi:Mg2+/Co2+ transporter CorC